MDRLVWRPADIQTYYLPILLGLVIIGSNVDDNFTYYSNSFAQLYQFQFRNNPGCCNHILRPTIPPFENCSSNSSIDIKRSNHASDFEYARPRSLSFDASTYVIKDTLLGCHSGKPFCNYYNFSTRVEWNFWFANKWTIQPSTLYLTSTVIKILPEISDGGDSEHKRMERFH